MVDRLTPDTTTPPKETTMNAMLPESMEGPTIAGMQIGETAYTLPWAMWADSDRHLWLNPDYPAEARPDGTVEMRIERTPDGFRVWPTHGHSYRPGGGHYEGGTKGRLPVVKLER